MSKILEKIFETAEKFPQKIAFIGARKVDQEFIEEKISYQDLASEIKITAAALQKLDYNKIALIADNSPSWIIFDLACLQAKVTLVPLPQFFTDDQLNNALELENIEAIFVDNELTAKRFSQKILQKFSFELAGISWFCCKISNKKNPKSQIAKITFTSGSTGNPKGIALSSKQIDATTFALCERIGEKNFGKNLSIFPLSILLENIAGVYLQLITQGVAIIPSLAVVGIVNSSGINVEDFVKAIIKYDPISFITSPELAKLLVFLVKSQKISPKNFRFIAVGGAKVAVGLLDEAHKISVPLYQGYGLSECCSVVALNSQSENKNGAVGKILPHLQVKISAEGEILVKGNSLAENIIMDSDGYYETGDLGYFDNEGFLFISARKKNIFITSMMRNVNPEWVESEILKSFLISQVAVFGEAMPFNSAIIVPVNPSVTIEALRLEIEEANNHLPDYAQVKNIIIAEESFSVKNKMLTLTGRVRREEIWKNYESKIRSKNDIF